MIKRVCWSFCLIAGLAAPASAEVKVIVGGGILRDALGATLTPGSMVALVASTQDNVFGSPIPSTPFQAGTTFGGDDVVLAVFRVDTLYTGINGGAVGVASINYATLGIPGLGAGDPLALYWFPATSLSNGQILPNAAYGLYRTDAVINRSSTAWLAPDDSSGNTIELNFLTQAIGGVEPDSLANATLIIGGASIVVSVAATDPIAGEPLSGQGSGTFTFSRSGSTATDLTVNFTVGGTATSGTDFVGFGTVVTFALGFPTVILVVNVIDDLYAELNKTLILTLAPGSGYTIGAAGAATISIQDDDFTHSSDTDHNFRISLLELTRVIELYNTRNGTTRTGCYKVDATGEDGFAPEPTRTSGAVVILPFYHSGDSNRDGKFSLLELTRMIELYNYRSGTTRTGQYHIQPGTEDGFAAGP